MGSDRASSPRPGSKAVLGIAVLAASFLAACSGSGSPPTPSGSSDASSAVMGASPAPVISSSPSRITPGHGTPQAAVEGEVQAEFHGNWLLACSYASPRSREACLQGNADLGRESGRVIIDRADTKGDYALVELTGTVCNKVVGCVSNYYLDPSSGMPTGPSGSDFRASYDAALASASHGVAVIISPLPMIKVNGQWYINYG